jgi:hypothetical protein
MKTSFKPRRDFLKMAATGMAGAVLAPPRSLRNATSPASPPGLAGEIKLGVASDSLRAFSRSDAIKMILKLRAPYVNLEYEIDEKNPLPGMKQSFAYMRGVLAGMKI